jgi:hypothetical protein
MSFIIAIPSYKRAKTLRDKTLSLLKRQGIPASIIFIFVASTEEKEEYDSVLSPADYNTLVVGVPGMGYVRNFITAYFPLGQKIMNIDDDISDFKELVDDKLVETDMMSAFKAGFAELEDKKLRLFGFYPVANAFFMKRKIRHDLRYIVGAMWGIINPGLDVLTITLDDKEDYERSILMYLADNGVVRFEYYCPITKYYKEPGGMQNGGRTSERIDRSARNLVERFPRFASLNMAKKSGKTEVRLKAKKA